MSQSFDLLNRLGTNVSVLAGQTSAAEPLLQLSANEPAESSAQPAETSEAAAGTVGTHRNQSAAEFFALFAEPFEVEDAPVTPPPLSGTPAAALPPIERQDFGVEDTPVTPPPITPPLPLAALPPVERETDSNNTSAQVETPADPPGGARVTSSGGKSIAENLRELKEKKEMQMKERMELAKKREENESALRCLRERVLKHEKEQLDLERKRKAMAAEEGVTSRKIARLEVLQRRVEEVRSIRIASDHGGHGCD